MKKSIQLVLYAIIGVLVIGLGGAAFLFTGKASDLQAANLEVESRGTRISGLQSDLSTSQAEATDLRTKLNSSEGQVGTLKLDLAARDATITTLNGNVASLQSQMAKSEADLKSANSQLSSAQSSLSSAQAANTTLTQSLRKVQDARHFTSLDELTSWLQKDDTNTKYASLAKSTASKDLIQLAFILEERATRDGYLLPAYLVPNLSTGNIVVCNYAIVGDMMYIIDHRDDDVTSFFKLAYVQPSRPEPLP